MADLTATEFSWTAAAALENVDGCLEDLVDLLQVWKRQSPILFSQMREGLAQNDPSKIFLAAHTLKGSIQILALDEDCHVIKEIEAAARALDLKRVEILVREWETRLPSIETSIHRFLTENQ